MSKINFRPELKDLAVYVPGKPMEEVMKEFGLTEVVKLASNENPLGPSPKAVEAIKAEVENINIYPDALSVELREKIANYYNLSSNRVFVGNGAEELIKLLTETIINKGDEAIMYRPSFSLYKIAVDSMGGLSRVIQIEEDLSVDLNKALDLINEKTKMIFVCNPNNPTGLIVKKDELEEFLKKVPSNIVVLLDEAYFEFAKEDKEYPDGREYLDKYPNLAVLRTFSKVSGIAGVRCGYIMAQEEIINHIIKVKTVFNVNRLSQVAAIASLADREHIDNTIAINNASLNAMIELFDKHNLKYAKPGGNFIFVDLKKDSREVFKSLQSKGVIIRPGFLWGYDNYIRISSGTMEQTEILIGELEKILNA